MDDMTQAEREFIQSFKNAPDEQDNEVIQRNNVASITICYLKKCNHGVWLNDDIINYSPFY